MIKNKDDIHGEISRLLLERQDMKYNTPKKEVHTSNADELKKYKELLDSGIITEEEFNAKKKQLLDL